MTSSSTASQKFAPGTSREPRTVRTLRDDLISQIVRSDPTLEGLVLATLDADRKRKIGERIKELRELSPYTQPALAEALGYTTVRGYQKAEKTGGMEYERYEKLAELFDVDVNYILLGDTHHQAGDTQLDRIEQKLDEALSRFDTIEAQLALLVPAVQAPDKKSAATPRKSKANGTPRAAR